MNKKIIGFAGRQRCGKGTLTKMLVDEYGYKHLYYAKYLKELCCRILGEGVDIERLNQMKNDNVEINHVITFEDCSVIASITGFSEEITVEKLLGKNFRTVRDMLQIIGTNFIRRIDNRWHVKRLIEEIEKSDYDRFVIEDVRFPNEKKALEKLGGRVYFVMRPKHFEDISNHACETSLTFTDFPPEKMLVNDLSEEHFKSIFKRIVETECNLFKRPYKRFLQYIKPLEKNEYTKMAIESIKKNDGKIELEVDNAFELEKILGSISKYRTWSDDVLYIPEVKKVIIYNPLINEQLKMLAD